MAYYDIGEVFQQIEEDMIASMTRNLKRHLQTELDEGINYSMWQAEQLAALNEFKRNNSSLFKGYFSTINDQIEEVLRKAHETGKMDQEIQILEAIREGWSTALQSSDNLQGAFFRINDRKLNALIDSVTNDMKKAETAMLRQANDEYRKIIFNSQAYYNTGAGTLPQCVDMATKDFLASGINCIEYKNGARVGIDAYARMAIRTANTRAYLLGESSKRDEWGVSTVIVNKRGVACPKCLKYVGRVFYDDVWGSAPIPSPEKYPRLSEAIAGGLYHPNCKDIHTTYFEGVTTPPKPMTDAEKKEASRVYDLEQRQRYNERQIRKYKRLSDGSVDPENQARYQKKLEAWQDAQKKFVKANGDVLKRRYENEKLLVSEFAEPPNASAKNKNYNVQNKFGQAILFDDKLNDEKWHNSVQSIKSLADEYDTRLTEVKLGGGKFAGTAFDTTGIVTLRSTEIETAYHEFAHTIATERLTKLGVADDSEFWKEIRRVRTQYRKEVGSDATRWISWYADSENKIDEFMAEAFTHAKMHQMGLPLPSHYGTDFTYSNKVLNIVDKYFKKPLTKSSNSVKIGMQFFAESDIKKQSSNSLKRAMRKYKDKIALHQDKIANPQKYIPDWDSKDVREQNGLKKHWQKEINNFQTSIDNRIAELKVRGDYDE